MKNLITTLLLTLACFAGSLSAGLNVASAINCNNPTTTKEQIQCGACDASGGNCPGNPGGTVSKTISTGINVFSALIGAIAVIMLMVGGFRYITSAGNAEGAKTARNTIIYALVGLVIVAIAQVIVHFVINTTAVATKDCVNGKTSTGQKC